jgi:hypothetical protein
MSAAAAAAAAVAAAAAAAVLLLLLRPCCSERSEVVIANKVVLEVKQKLGRDKAFLPAHVYGIVMRLSTSPNWLDQLGRVGAVWSR